MLLQIHMLAMKWAVELHEEFQPEFIVLTFHSCRAISIRSWVGRTLIR